MRYPLIIVLLSCLFVVMNSYAQSTLSSGAPVPIDSISVECTQPLTWRVGSIDPRFEIDREILIQLMKDVQNLWSDAMDTPLIEYSDNGEVVINFIYSEDQKITDNERGLSEKINKMKKNYYSMKTDYQSELAEFQRKPIQNNHPFLELEEKVNEYILQYNNRFSQMRTFHNAIYIDTEDRKEVNIYQFENIGKLRLVLAHEFGHVLGLRHARNPLSIMYHRMRLQNDKIPKLTREDIRAIRNRCGL